MQRIHCFTTKYGRISRRLLTKCFVSAAWLPQDDSSAPPLLEFDALWDTGATASVVTADVATKLELPPEGTSEVFHAQGSTHVPNYFVNLGLPNRVGIAGLRVTEGILKGCDVLIGMDVINLGDFAVTNRDGETIFSFQMPSIHQIDFVEIMERRKRKGISDVDT